jgi:hypothetical protein
MTLVLSPFANPIVQSTKQVVRVWFIDHENDSKRESNHLTIIYSDFGKSNVHVGLRSIAWLV